jgi:transposase
VDNARAHHGKLVKNFMKHHPKTFRLEYFPKYTPELNPTEACWKPARKVLSNRLIKSLPSAQYHLRKVFKNEKNMPKMFQYLGD